MRIAVIGGGPGGLYFSYLWKKRHPDARIDLFEQNPAGATWGFGVVFSEQALEFLRADDPDTVDAIAPRMESWENITLYHHGEDVALDGVGHRLAGEAERHIADRGDPAADHPSTTTQARTNHSATRHDRIARWDVSNGQHRGWF